MNSNISNKGNYKKNILDNGVIRSNKNRRVNTIDQVIDRNKLISVINKEIDLNKNILENNKFRKYDWKKEICYFFCNECYQSKSFFINLFQTFLSIENIMRWNQEWVAFKIAEMDSLEQLTMKYIDVDRLKLENNLHPFERNEEELSDLIKRLKEHRVIGRRYGNLEKLLL